MCHSDAIPNLDWLMLSSNRLSNLAVSALATAAATALVSCASCLQNYLGNDLFCMCQHTVSLFAVQSTACHMTGSCNRNAEDSISPVLLPSALLVIVTQINIAMHPTQHVTAACVMLNSHKP